MEGENKDMKMKKLTALALAGVLCLGMSTTALASTSPVPATAENEKDEIKVGAVKKDPLVNDVATINTIENDWGIRKGETSEEASVRIENDIKGWIGDLESQKSETDSLDEKAAIDKKLTELKKLDGTKLELVSLADVDCPNLAGDRDLTKDPVKVKFNLNGRNVAAGDKISIMHEVKDPKTGATYWTVVTDLPVVKYTDEKDPSKSMYYVEYDFTSFSNVVLLKQLSNGGTDVIPNDPTKPTDPTDQPTVTPDANGNITADQLAELIVKKLENRVNATKVVRTAVSSKASPKTGE